MYRPKGRLPETSDQVEWNRLWAETTKMLLPGKCKIDLDAEYKSLKLIVSSVALPLDPEKYADRVLRTWDLCPVCGTTTDGQQRSPATLIIVFEEPEHWTHVVPPNVRCGAWVHTACIQCCQDTGESAGLPWRYEASPVHAY